MTRIPLAAPGEDSSDAPFVEVGELPEELRPDDVEPLWALRPAEPDVLLLYGRQVPIPRFQRAYGRDYRFSNQTSVADAIPALLEPMLAWARALDPRINGLLVNWYDAAHKHYIGPHRDSPIGRVPDSPIVTMSFGASRCFRMRRYRGRPEERVDLEVGHGSVV